MKGLKMIFPYFINSMTVHKKIYSLIGLVILIGVAAATMVSCKPKEPEVAETVVYKPAVSTQVVSAGLSQPFSVTGEVFANKVSTVTAEQRGTVQRISIAVGDTVQAGGVAVSLESSSVSSQYSTSKTALDNAKSNFDQTAASSQKAIESAKISLTTAQANLENTLKQNETLKRQAEESLNSTSVSVDLGVQSSQTNFDNVIKGAFPTVQAAANTLDQLLGVSSVYRFSNDAFENNLGAMDAIGKR
ncbi:efflux RND transporter periplasmic adaptor subunit [Candidatus Peregrinibacteria bacterium]|nr:MAG: efflux RND transporter periplasmic adaptor subunit [Candidatus Peregrinibacteria bacterium]